MDQTTALAKKTAEDLLNYARPLVAEVRAALPQVTAARAAAEDASAGVATSAEVAAAAVPLAAAAADRAAENAASADGSAATAVGAAVTASDASAIAVGAAAAASADAAAAAEARSEVVISAAQVASDTAAAEDARGGAEAAASQSAAAAAQAALAATTVSAASWLGLAAITPAFVGQRATVSLEDAGTHAGRTAASPGADAAATPNSGIYGAYALSAGAWRRDGDVPPLAMASTSVTVAGMATDVAASPKGVRDAIAALAVTSFRWPSVSAADVHLDGSNRPGPAPLTSDSPVLSDIADRLGGVEISAPFLWPSLEPGVVYVDAAGARGPVALTAQSPTITALASQVDALAIAVEGSRAAAVRAIGDVLHGIWYGQSLSIGTSAGSLLTTAAVPGGLRFSSGVRPMDSGSEDPADWGASFAALVETQSAVNSGLRETTAGGFVQRFNERLAADFGCALPDLGQSVLMTSAGQGGASHVELSDPSVPFTRLMNVIEHAGGMCASAGQTYNPLFLGMIQGEASQGTEAESFYAGWHAIWQAAKARADTLRGFERPLLFVAYQTAAWPTSGWNTPKNAEAFLWFHERNEHGLFAAPIYHLPYSDSLHLLAAGYKRLGAHFADVVYDYVIHGYKRPVLRPRVERLDARRLVLHYDLRPGARLVLDEAAATAAGETITQHGIRVVGATDDANTASDPATNIPATVRLAGADTLLVVADADIPTGGACEVRQGWYDTTVRNCTHIRDTAGDVLPVFDPGVLNVRLHNWAPVCRVSIP